MAQSEGTSEVFCIQKMNNPPRQPSGVGAFMNAELAKLKETHPDLNHKERFAMAAER